MHGLVVYRLDFGLSNQEKKNVHKKQASSLEDPPIPDVNFMGRMMCCWKTLGFGEAGSKPAAELPDHKQPCSGVWYL